VPRLDDLQQLLKRNPRRDVHIFNDTPARVHVTMDAPDDTDWEK
tara:strand:+ start:16387 stop:16518 length:132 start_codon:yes stop_codon:yes gene_type:complete